MNSKITIKCRFFCGHHMERERRERALARANEKIPNGNQPGRSATECTNQVQRAPGTGNWCNWTDRDHAEPARDYHEIKTNEKHQNTPRSDNYSGPIFLNRRTTVCIWNYLGGSGACSACSAIFLSSAKEAHAAAYTPTSAEFSN